MFCKSKPGEGVGDGVTGQSTRTHSGDVENCGEVEIKSQQILFSGGSSALLLSPVQVWRDTLVRP